MDQLERGLPSSKNRQERTDLNLICVGIAAVLYVKGKLVRGDELIELVSKSDGS